MEGTVMPYVPQDHVRDKERTLLVVLWLFSLVPLVLAGWAMVPSPAAAPEPPGVECAIHAHDQAQVGECLERVTE